MIRDATLNDASAITGIYNHYVRHSYATMEYDPVEETVYEKKIQTAQNSGHSWLVAEEEKEIIGYAYSGAWNPRDGYKHTCEVSVYISHTVTTKGWGTKLYTELFDRLKNGGMKTIIAVIGLPNEASVALHEKFGMKKVAHFPKMGIKFDQWQDVGYWQVNWQ